MKLIVVKPISRLWLIAFITCSLWASAVFGITVDNIITMHESKLPSNIIVQTIKSSGVTFNLTLKDIKRLKDAGVPQEVIDAMMPKDAVQPAPEPEPQDDLQATKEAEDQALVDEEAQKRIQAAVAAEKRRIQEEKMKIVEAQLAKSQALLDDEEYLEALKGFDQFLMSGESIPAGRAKALFGYAESLYGLGLYANAMAIYEEILQTSPDENPVFERAFKRFRACTQEVSYDGIPGALNDHYVGNFSQEFQDSYKYFLGKLFFTGNNYDEARIFLEEVSNTGADYARARYILGLIGVKEAGPVDDPDFGVLIKSNRFFIEAINLAEQPKYKDSLRRVIELSYLGLARIAYTLGTDIPGSYDAALFYYGKVPTDSTNYIQALYESAWAYFLKGNINRGMGIFHTLDGPDWANQYLPYIFLLEAQVFLNLCQTMLAKKAIERLRSKYLNLRGPLELFMETYPEDLDRYRALVLGETKKGVVLPRRLKLSVIAESDFYESYGGSNRYSKEVSYINEQKSSLGDDFTARLLERAKELKEEKIATLGTMISRILNKRLSELEELDEKVEEMLIEVETQEADKLEEEISKGYKGQITQNKTEEEAQSRETANLLVGTKYITWPFEGEYWADEINNYRSQLTSQCRDE